MTANASKLICFNQNQNFSCVRSTITTTAAKPYLILTWRSGDVSNFTRNCVEHNNPSWHQTHRKNRRGVFNVLALVAWTAWATTWAIIWKHNTKMQRLRAKSCTRSKLYERALVPAYSVTSWQKLKCQDWWEGLHASCSHARADIFTAITYWCRVGRMVA